MFVSMFQVLDDCLCAALGGKAVVKSGFATMSMTFTASCGGLVVLECWKHLQFGILGVPVLACLQVRRRTCLDVCGP